MIALFLAALVDSAGGNVNLVIHGNVRITAGGNGNEPHSELRVSPKQTVRSHACAAETTHEDIEKYTHLCKTVNRQTCRTVTTDIAGNFRDENLNEPDFKVYPQMRKVKNFFKGGYEKWDEEIVLEANQSGQDFQRTVVRNQMRREIGFYYQGEQDGDELITKNQLLERIMKKVELRPRDKNPVTAIVASAGSGKTTLLRRIAEEALSSCPIFACGDGPKDQESHLKMIYFKDMKHMRFNGQIKPSQFLFEGSYRSDTEMDDAYEWLLEHQREAILFFDGLDQATFSIDESSKRDLTPYQKGTASEIMYNILSRKLLPHAKIVIASREFKVSELPAEARPQEIITLLGFKRKDAEKLFVSLINDHGDEIWSDIKRLSPRLLNILSVPMFLVLTAAIMVCHPNDSPPTTITELYNRICLCLRRVENIQERRRIIQIIKKLKALAHQGMKEGRVVFREADLKRFGLTIEDARDLMIKVPGNNLLSHYLLEGDFEFFFCHQSLQEFLSASFVAEMKGSDFCVFNESQLHQSRWSVVRTFVSGIIHDMSMTDLHEVAESKLKRIAFAQSIPTLINNQENGVGLLAAIYESNDDKLIQSLPRMPSMTGSRIGFNEAFMFGSILTRRGNVHENLIDLYECGLTDELVETIVQNIKGPRIQVDDLDVKFNSLTAKGLNSLLNHFDTKQVTIDYPRVSEFRYGQLDWTNIRKIRWGALRNIKWKFTSPGFEMINEDKNVSMEGLINGRFCKEKTESEEDKRLILEGGVKSQVLDLMIFFEQKRFGVLSEDHILVTAAKLMQMKTLNMKGMIKKMLLDCRSNTCIDSLVIVSCLETFGVTCLDILVNYETSFVPPNFLSDIGAHINLDVVDVNLHWWFKLIDTDDVKKLISFVAANQIKNIRLQCHGHISLDDISNVIKTCKLTSLSLKYWYSSMSEDDYKVMLDSQQPMKELAKLHSVEYAFVNLLEYTAVIKNAWEEADRRRIH